jgi:DNA-binding NarL/FixJ family response regulator
VDDHRVFAGALAHRLGAEPDLEVVAVATTAAAAEALAGSLLPDLAVVDVELGRDGGLALAARLSGLDGGPVVVALTCQTDARTTTAAARAGARGLVAKDAPVEQLLLAIRAALAPERPSPPAEADHPLARLTGREREVLGLMVAGLDRSAIGARLFLSPNTVRTHVQNVLRKLEVHSSIEAVGLALRQGLRPPAPDA